MLSIHGNERYSSYYLVSERLIRLHQMVETRRKWTQEFLQGQYKVDVNVTNSGIYHSKDRLMIDFATFCCGPSNCFATSSSRIKACSNTMEFYHS